MYKIGIVGNGYVGGAVAHGFSPTSTGNCDVKVYDKMPERSLNTLDEVVNESDFVFVSVPTPMTKKGSISLRYINQVFKEINGINRRLDNIIILKSTVVPGTTEKLQEKFPSLNIVFNPEFLTERSAKFDFINQARFIVGGKKRDADKVEELFRWRFGYTTPIIKTNYETAELIKYMNNCFFATKVSFLNEMYQIADACGVDWDMAVEGFVRDGRVGHSHMNVPGPDGKFGFGGSCFPKDIQAMIHFANSLGVEPSVLNGAWDKNLDVRPEKDWKKLKGRAVVDE